MSTPLNKPNATYRKKNGMKHVFVSSHIHINKNDIGYIEKPFLDYKTMKPVFLKKYFNKTTHRFNVHRYVKSCSFKKDELVFISLDKWEDPYETLLYIGNNEKNNMGIQIACLCSTYERVEGEEASWNRSTYNSDKPVIRLSYNYNVLCSILKQIADQDDVRFYITIANYTNSREQLLGARGISFTSEEDYINHLTLKRKAFFYENELRIFVIGEKLPLDEYGICKFKIPSYNGLYDSVTLPPFKPFTRDDVRYPLYSEIQFIVNLPLRRELEKVFPPSDIHQCHLYEIEKSLLERRYKK